MASIYYDPPGVMWARLEFEGWEVSARLAAQDGVPVVVELRVESANGTPTGGLTARAMRRLPLGQALEAGRAHLAKMEGAGWEDMTKPGFDLWTLWLHARHGDPLIQELSSGESGRGRGDRFYAVVAAAYVSALGKGTSKPVVAAAEALSERLRGSYTPRYVRGVLAEARRRELLTRPQPGRAGGELTSKAKDLLKGTER